MASLVVFNDPHYSIHPPEVRGKEYPKQILSKMHYCARMAHKIGASTIACTGDWFHRKGRVPFREANDLLSCLSQWRNSGLHPIGILGNHDISGYRLDSYHRHAIGTLVRSETLTLLDTHPVWIEDDKGSIYCTGKSYFDGCDRDDDSRALMYGAERPEADKHFVHVHLAHGTLLQEGGFPAEYTLAEDLVQLLEDRNVCPDIIICGHLHHDEGIRNHKTKSGRVVRVCRVGSLGRVSVDDLDRTPRAIAIKVHGERVACRGFDIKHDIVKPPRVVTDISEDSSPDRIKDFVQTLRIEADLGSLDDYHRLFRQICSARDLSDNVLKYLINKVEIGIEK